MLRAEFFISGVKLHRPLNGVKQLRVALNAADGDLVLQSKVAFIDDFEFRQSKGTTGLPKGQTVSCNNRGGAFGIRCLNPAHRVFTLGVLPFARSVFIVQRHIQSARLNLVYRGGCGIGKPCKGGTNEHSNAHECCTYTGY